MSAATANRLVLVRGDGWPLQLARMVLAAGLTWLISALAFEAASGQVALGVLWIGLGLMLAMWRRGVTLEPATAQLTRWYGLGVARFTVPLRNLEERTLDGYTRVEVVLTEHYKAWKRMYAVVLYPDEGLNRLVIDDEFRSPEPALEAARQVSERLGLELLPHSLKG